MNWRKLFFVVFALSILGCIFVFVAIPRIVDSQFNRITPIGIKPTTDVDRALHAELFVADMHADSTLWSRSLLASHGRGHIDLERLRRGNVGLQIFTTVTKSPRNLNIERNDASSDDITLLAFAQRWPVKAWGSLFARANYQAQRLDRWIDASEGALVAIQTREDIERLLQERSTGKTATGVVLGMEGVHPIEGELEALDDLFAVGFRVVGLTHFFDNEVAGSRHGISGAGLSSLGRRVVARAQELGMVVDLAHASEAALRETIAMARAPVIVSHGGVKGTCDNNRNLSDAELRLVADTGGVIGIGFWPEAVCDISPDGIARAIRHAVNVAGIDHVGLGSDFDGAVTTAFGIDELIQITSALRRAGFSDEEVAKVMGGNVARLLLAVLPRNADSVRDRAG